MAVGRTELMTQRLVTYDTYNSSNDGSIAIKAVVSADSPTLPCLTNPRPGEDLTRDTNATLHDGSGSLLFPLRPPACIPTSNSPQLPPLNFDAAQKGDSHRQVSSVGCAVIPLLLLFLLLPLYYRECDHMGNMWTVFAIPLPSPSPPPPPPPPPLPPIFFYLLLLFLILLVLLTTTTLGSRHPSCATEAHPKGWWSYYHGIEERAFYCRVWRKAAE